jgi:hypothetical protein
MKRVNASLYLGWLGLCDLPIIDPNANTFMAAANSILGSITTFTLVACNVVMIVFNILIALNVRDSQRPSG